jgi:exopolyphosphatase/guanosine-5'-triphosphate,3'-diphosphate pyrophosphatase
MRLGVLDIGSNAAQLRIVDTESADPLRSSFAVKQPTRLAGELQADGALTETGTQRVITAVQQSLLAAHRHGVEELLVYVTAAIRDAANREQVLDRIQRHTAIRPQFLSGEDEARLTYTAARHWLGTRNDNLFVLDVGGGSTEFAFGSAPDPAVALSLPLGVRPLTADFLPDDPPSRAQLGELGEHVRSQLKQVAYLLSWEDRATHLIGTSKTIKQLAKATSSRRGRCRGYRYRVLEAKRLSLLTEKLASVPSTERAAMRGISRSRARQIVAGAVVAEQVMAMFRLSAVAVCPWALREGVLLNYVETSRRKRGTSSVNSTRIR